MLRVHPVSYSLKFAQCFDYNMRLLAKMKVKTLYIWWKSWNNLEYWCVSISSCKTQCVQMFMCSWVFSTKALLFPCVESYNRLIRSFQGLWLLQRSLIPKYLSLHELLMWKFSFRHQQVHLMDLCWVILPSLPQCLLGELVWDLNQFSDPMMSSNRFNFWPLKPHVAYAFFFFYEKVTIMGNVT